MSWIMRKRYVKSLEVDFVINTNTHWEEPPRARHQFTYALTKKYRVVFIAASKVGLPKIDVKNEKNIIIIQPYFFLSSKIRYRIPVINEIYQIWLFRWVRKKMNTKGVVNFDFTAYLIYRFFKDVYYYCNDNFTSISRKINVWPVYKYHQFCERKLIRGAKICIGTSPIITKNLVMNNKRSYEIPLGAPDIEEFQIIPRRSGSLKKIINIGLVGFISLYNTSYELINNILREINCKIIFIGPVDSGFLEKIYDRERIITRGVLEGKALLDEVNRFDVAIAPYLGRKIQEGGVPNKLFLYLALGKPVVATALMSIKTMNLQKGLVYLVENKEKFPEIIIKAHYDNTDDLIRERVEYAKKNTWNKRIEDFISLIEYKKSINNETSNSKF